MDLETYIAEQRAKRAAYMRAYRAKVKALPVSTPVVTVNSFTRYPAEMLPKSMDEVEAWNADSARFGPQRPKPGALLKKGKA